MSPWLVLLLLATAVVLAVLIVHRVDQRTRRQQAEDEAYWRGQLARLAEQPGPDWLAVERARAEALHAAHGSGRRP